MTSEKDPEYGDAEMRRLSVLRNLGAKAFIKVGGMYVDLKHCFSFGFEPDPDGYIFFTCSSVYNINEYAYIRIPDRNQLALFFLELEPFIDDENLLCSLTALIDEIDEMAVAAIEYYRSIQDKTKKKRGPKKKKD